MAEPQKLEIEEEREETVRSACSLCLKNQAKYTCPRCNISYCSVDCYKSEKHMDCSETFYKECFMEGLKESTADPEDKKRVLEMLKRAETDPDLTDLDHQEDDLEERLGDLDLDTDADQIWERLTDQEKKEFQAMVGDGRLGSLVDLWMPWWRIEEPLVQEIPKPDNNRKLLEGSATPGQVQQINNKKVQSSSVKSKYEKGEGEAKPTKKSKLVNQSDTSKLVKKPGSQSSTESSIIKSKADIERIKGSKLVDISIPCKPKMKSDIPNMSDLIRTMPSADMKYSVINVLYAYAFVCRLHNGEHVPLATESAQDILEISEVMGQGHSCGSAREAIQACVTRIQSAGLKYESTCNYNLSVIKDVQQLIDCSSGDSPVLFVMLALSDLYETLKAAHKNCSASLRSIEEGSRKETLKKEKSDLFRCMKKCDFMLSWVQTYGMALAGLVPELEIEYSVLACELESVNQSKQQLEKEWGGITKPKQKTLVEEL